MASSSKATTYSDGPRYQGYPYVNLPAFGVPTIDSHTASRYADLPRRPLDPAVRVRQDGSSTPYDQNNAKSPDSDDEPVLYIDLPGDGESDIYVRGEDSPIQHQRTQNQPIQSKEDEHVVYIDLPECSGSGVSDRGPEDGTATVVQQTIYYDQFKNRRIDVIPQSGAENSFSGSSGLPERPTNLNLCSPGNFGSPASRPTLTIAPPYLSPDRSYSSPAEDFRLSPLPVTDYPDPPPAYTEIDFGNPGRRVTVQSPVESSTSTVTTPPRTTVILHDSGIYNSSRKVVTCEHCMVTVNSVVVRQITYETHLVALACFALALIPLIPFVYYCDICKSDIFYCPICNGKIKKEFKFC